MARAVACQQASRLTEAAELCRQVLAEDPLHVEALYVLGTVSYQSGRLEEAIEHLTGALSVAPGRAEIRNVLGLALAQANRPAEAETAFREAIAAAPSSSQAHNNLGSLLRRVGRLDEAAECQRRAVALDPGNPMGHYNLGNTLRAAGDLDAAAACYRRALEIRGDSVDALANLGEVLHALGRAGEAVDVLRKAAAVADKDAGVRGALGDALQTFGRLEEAIDAYTEALAIDETALPARYGLGCAQLALEHYADAAKTLRTAVAGAPEAAPVNHNLGKALLQLGRVDEAMAYFGQAAKTDPAGPAMTALAVSIPGAPGADNEKVLAIRRRWGELLPRPGSPPGPARPPAEPGGRLRVGYLSGFFQSRNWMKPVWALINRHDRERFEIHLLSDAPQSACAYGYRRHETDRFHDISDLSNEQVARRLAEAGVDLLIDLNGFSFVRRLGVFAAKPAPVVAGWFNLYATTGLETFDYLIGDEHVIDADEEAFYSERILRVPGSYLTFEVNYPVPDVAEPPCTRGRGFTFGCLASQYKITPQVADAWAQILRKCPDSRLLLQNATLNSADNRRFVRDLFEGLGVSADRLELHGPAEHYEFLRRYNDIDLALDPFPYNGGTTTTEAIWQGVGVLTFRGDRWASRTSASILNAGGLSEFVTDDVEAYIAEAERWATDTETPERLADLRATMRDRLRASPVCDTEGFARNMERLYTGICRPG